ncbi:MAG: hypothetical protein JST32_12335 [Bacteroidetes bacterium]|nr:hypothetical protein [Bacteroidota bacterium]
MAARPAAVFSTMDIGVIVLGALVGLFVFREKLSRLNIAGIFLGIVAILINAFPNLFERF